MPIDPAYSNFADFIINNPSKLANLQAVTRLNQANAQAQQTANQQSQQTAQSQQAFNQILGSLNQSHMSSLQKGTVGIGQPAPQVNVPDVAQELPQRPQSMGVELPGVATDDGNTTVPPMVAPEAPQPIAAAADPTQRDPNDTNDISNTDPDLVASKAAMMSRPSPDGTIRTPEGLVVRAGTGADSYNAAAPQPIASASAGTPSPVAASSTAPAAPFTAELARQNAQKQQIRTAYQSLADDPSSWTRDVGGQLLADPRVQSSPQLTQMAINWIQQRQEADAKVKEANGKASTAALNAKLENLKQADAELRGWFGDGQTEQRRAQSWPQELAKLMRDGRLSQEDADQAPQQYPGDAAFPALLAHLTNTHELITSNLADADKQAQLDKLKRENGTGIVTQQLAPYLAGRYKAGDSAPNADIAEANKAYNTANEKKTERDSTEAAQREGQVKADIAQALGKGVKDLTPAEINQGRRIFSAPTTIPGEEAAADARAFIAANKRLPTDAEYSKMVAEAAAKTRPLNINNQPENKDDMEANADMIANYQADPPSIVRKGSPAEAIMARVHALDPNYSKIKYEAFKNTEKSATSGKLAEAAKSIRTMTGHMEALSEAANALNNKNIVVLNRIANEFGFQTGKDPKTVYQTIVNRLAPEIEKAYVPEGGTAAERGIHASDFDSSLSPTQIQNNIRTAIHLAGSLVDSLQHQYREGTYGRGNVDLLDDQSRNFYNKSGVTFQEKTVPVSKVDQFAAEHNIDERAAKKYFRDHGYMVYE